MGFSLNEETFIKKEILKFLKFNEHIIETFKMLIFYFNPSKGLKDKKNQI
jgi:hypothetical protein